MLILPVGKAIKINQVYKDQRDSIYWLGEEIVVMRDNLVSMSKYHEYKYKDLRRQYDSSLVRNVHIEKKYADLKIEATQNKKEYSRTFRGMALYLIVATIYMVSMLDY